MRVQCGPGMHWLLSETSLPRLGGGVRSQKSIQTPQTRESAAQPKPRLLRFQERIKGPKNASIARFDGLCCYQSRSEIGNGFWARAAKAVLQMGFRRVLNTSARIRRGPGHALAAFGNQPARTWQAEAGKQKKRSNAANVRKRKQAQPSPIPVLLRFQEQIKGPKNAPIARFDGLGCYQSRSKKTGRLRGRPAARKRLFAGAEGLFPAAQQRLERGLQAAGVGFGPGAGENPGGVLRPGVGRGGVVAACE